MSSNGNLVAFVSYQQRSHDGLRHAEVWLKNKFKKTANLLVNLEESVSPYLLLWSPDNKNLLLVDTNRKLHLINVISKSLTPLLNDYQEISNVNWDKDGEHINFSSNSGNKREQWQYNLTNKTTDVLPTSVETIDIKGINLTYDNYLGKVEQYLLEQVGFNLPVDDLMPSLQKFTPYVFGKGIYYVVKEGKQLKLYRYLFEDSSNKLVAHLGSYEQDLTISLNIASSADGKQIVFNSVDTMETDILVQSKQVTNK